MKRSRVAIITVVSSILLISLFCFAAMKSSSTAAATLAKSAAGEGAKSRLSPYARVEAPTPIAPPSL